jgi:hypothetical protein
MYPPPKFSQKNSEYYSIIMASTTVQIPSLCIPRVFFQFDEAYIEQVFYDLFGADVHGKSCVERIDLINKEDRRTGEPFLVAFLHFVKEMPVSEELTAFIQRIESGEEVKIVYRYPWFWKVRKNVATKHTRRGPRIMSANDEAELRKFQKEFAIKRKGSTTPNSGDEPVKNNSSSDIQQAAEAAEAAEVTEVVEAADTCK